MASPQAVTDGALIGAATGIGTGLISWLFPLFRSRHLAARVKKLEAQAEKSRAFQEVVIKSQMTQIDLFQLIIDRQGVACADCPIVVNTEKDHRTQKIIDDGRKELMNYLGRLV